MCVCVCVCVCVCSVLCGGHTQAPARGSRLNSPGVRVWRERQCFFSLCLSAFLCERVVGTHVNTQPDIKALFIFPRYFGVPDVKGAFIGGPQTDPPAPIYRLLTIGPN